MGSQHTSNWRDALWVPFKQQAHCSESVGVLNQKEFLPETKKLGEQIPQPPANRDSSFQERLNHMQLQEPAKEGVRCRNLTRQGAWQCEGVPSVGWIFRVLVAMPKRQNLTCLKDMKWRLTFRGA